MDAAVNEILGSRRDTRSASRDEKKAGITRIVCAACKKGLKVVHREDGIHELLKGGGKR